MGYSPWGPKESDTTDRLNNKSNIVYDVGVLLKGFTIILP